jgi:hypothetical protein
MNNSEDVSMKRLRSLTVASVCVVATTVAACSSSSKATEVVKIAPLDISGKVRSGYSITHMTGDIGCYASSPSAVDSDIVSCGDTANAADVCWVNPDHTTVLCGVSPWDKKLREFTSAASIKTSKPEADPMPWAMELGSGDKCRRRTGGAADTMPFGLIPAYYCQDASHVVVTGTSVKLLDKTSTKWSVQIVDTTKAAKAGSSYKLPSRQSVAKVYFAGRAS